MEIVVERDYKQAFDVRSINLTKVDKVVDLEIVVSEAEYAIAHCQSQISDGFGDAIWLQDVNRAIREIEHKKSLAIKKLEAIKAFQAIAKIAPSEDSLFKSRFMKAAQEFLPTDVYKLIFEAARTTARSAA